MRFILFNAAVIAALVTIYSAERDGSLPTMERPEGIFAAEAPPVDPVSPHEAMADAIFEAAPEPVIETVVEPVAETIAAAPAAIEPQESVAPAPVAAPVPVAVTEPSEALALEPLKEEFVAGVPEAIAPRVLPPVSDPAVAKRRQEILEGLDGVPTTAPVILAEAQAPLVLAEGESLMSNRERITELHRLAEEMELLFVKSLAK